MDQLDAMRVYVAVVESQGFSAASCALRIPVLTVCRKVAKLDEKLAVQLLVRSTRKVSTTSSGMHYYYDARRILEDYEIEPTPVIIAIPRGPRATRKVNAFVDFAESELRRRLQ